MFASSIVMALLNDEAVQSTSDEAAISKMSSVLKGYYRDDALQYFVREPANRSPLINRGYYSRVMGIRRAIDTFFECTIASPIVQVVNLGAGLDTTYWYIRQKRRDFKYFEVDFPSNSYRKGLTIMKNEGLRQVITQNKDELYWYKDTELRGPNFALVGGDMRDHAVLSEKLLEAGLQKDLPTLFLSECVIVYMPPREADGLIQWLASFIDKAPIALVMYEQINPFDAFGRTMIANLASRGCPLLALPTYPTIGAQRARFTTLGWGAFAGGDMNEIYDYHFGASELARIQRLELFDELEEWRLIQGHYFIGIAVRGPELIPLAADADAPAAAKLVVDTLRSHPYFPSVHDEVADPALLLSSSSLDYTNNNNNSNDNNLGILAPMAKLYTPASRQAPISAIRYSIPPGVNSVYPQGLPLSASMGLIGGGPSTPRLIGGVASKVEGPLMNALMNAQSSHQHLHHHVRLASNGDVNNNMNDSNCNNNNNINNNSACCNMIHKDNNATDQNLNNNIVTRDLNNNNNISSASNSPMNKPPPCCSRSRSASLSAQLMSTDIDGVEAVLNRPQIHPSVSHSHHHSNVETGDLRSLHPENVGGQAKHSSKEGRRDE